MRERAGLRAAGRVVAPALLVVALWLAAAPAASAYRDWSHATAIGKRSCAVGCHAEQPPTNATCTGCHQGFKAGPGQWCWTCHQPGQNTSAWQLGTGCTTSCHLWTEITDPPGYTTGFAHAAEAHLGASDYGKTCTDCHRASLGAASPGGSPHHDGAEATSPSCAECHDGTIAASPPGHDSFGDVCTACHNGMDRPSGDCAACHTGNEGSSVPQVDFTNDLACADAACHGGVDVHADTPVTGLPCTTCHTGHYAAFAACEDCHLGPEAYHHGTTAARDLVDCEGCHDGTSGVARVSHATLTCVICHSGMSRPPAPEVCLQCHFRTRFGTDMCTTCHSVDGLTGSEQVHTATPGTGLTCGSCHDEHHTDLGSCGSCHARPPEVHHGTTANSETVLTLRALPDGALGAGSPALLAGSLAGEDGPLAGATVQLQMRRLGGSAFTELTTLYSGVDGEFSYEVRPVCGTEYRAVFRGSSWVKPVVTVQQPALERVTVKVAQRLTLRARPATVRKGARIRISGALAPSAQQLGDPRPAVNLRLERKSGARWSLVASARAVSRADGSFSRTWPGRRAGAYRVRAAVAGSVELLAAKAKVRVRVR